MSGINRVFDTGLEQWAVERAAAQFRQVYQKPLTVASVRL